MKIKNVLLILYVIVSLFGCGRGERTYILYVYPDLATPDLMVVDMAWDMTYPSGQCGNGDSPDGRIGFCPCCEVRDKNCNIPDREAEWCTACLEHEKSKGTMGDMYPCRSPVP